jgi:hypothetical protein
VMYSLAGRSIITVASQPTCKMKRKVMRGAVYVLSVICLLAIHPSIHLSIYPASHPAICLSVRLSVCMYACMYVYLSFSHSFSLTQSIYLSTLNRCKYFIFLSIHTYIHTPSIHPSIYPLLNRIIPGLFYMLQGLFGVLFR